MRGLEKWENDWWFKDFKYQLTVWCNGVFTITTPCVEISFKSGFSVYIQILWLGVGFAYYKEEGE